MTDNNRAETVTRRGVLRQGTLAAGTVTLGVVGFSGTALASDCPRTPGFWANHDWCEVATANGSTVGEDIFGNEECEGTKAFNPVGEMTMEEWQAFLLRSAGGDKGYIMAKHIIATRLNSWRRPGGGSDTSCIDQQLDLSAYGLGTMSINEVEFAASQWLAASNWPDRQRSWRVDGTNGEPLKNVLDAFNNGQLDLDDCNCPSVD